MKDEAPASTHAWCCDTEVGPTKLGAPPVDVCKDVVRQFQSGFAPIVGYVLGDGTCIGLSRAQRLLWALADAVGQQRLEVRRAF